MNLIDLERHEYRVTGSAKLQPNPIRGRSWTIWATALPIWATVIMGRVWTQGLFGDLPGPLWLWPASAIIPCAVFFVFVIIKDQEP